MVLCIALDDEYDDDGDDDDDVCSAAFSKHRLLLRKYTGTCDGQTSFMFPASITVTHARPLFSLCVCLCVFLCVCLFSEA